jgi:hypothetical protein
MEMDTARVIVHSTKKQEGKSPADDGAGSMIEVTVQVRVLPYAENELVAHYLVNQAAREALEKVDRLGLDRIMAQEAHA